MNIYGQVGWRAAYNAPDEDAQAFITAATITNSTQQSAIDTLVKALKTANIWTKMKALYPFVGGTAAQHRFNLKDPRTVNAAFYLDFLGGGGHSATGYQPNGNSYADTKLIPSANFPTISDISIGFYSRTNIAQTSNDIGVYTSDIKALAIQTRWTDNKIYSQCYRDPNPYSIMASNTDSSGLFTLSRTSTTSLKQFRNSSVIGTSTTSMGGSIPTNSICLSNNGNSGSYSSREQAFAFIGNGLTDTEATNLYTAVQAYQTTLGRNV